jgi:Protein of unknown function (DUF3000)
VGETGSGSGTAPEAARRLAAPPRGFARAVERFRAASVRREVVLTEAPGPQRLAPWSAALTAEVVVDGDELATGRLVLLHDPVGHEAWQGDYRLVAYARAALDPEMAADPLLGAVAWSWLTDALLAAGAGALAPSGTVTRVASDSFGAIAGEVAAAELELRASWTPTDATEVPGLSAHVEAFAEVLTVVAGLPPLPAEVAVLPGPRWPRR